MTPFDGGRSGSTGGPSGYGGIGDVIPAKEIERIRSTLQGAVRRRCSFWLRDQAEDLVQTALLRLLELLDKSDGTREFSASYLDRTAYSALVDEIRKRRLRREVPLEPETHKSAPATRPNPEDKATGSALGRAILDCLRTLIDSRRQATTLYLRGHSARRCAEVKGWTVRQAENLILRGRRDLRKCLEGKGWTL